MKYITNIKWIDFEKFVDIKKNDQHYAYIKSVLLKIFPNLNNRDFDVLLDNYIKVINFILFKIPEAIHLDYVSKSTYLNNLMDQLKQNNDQDLVAILQLILPFIDEISQQNPYEKKQSLKSLKDLYLKTENNKYVYTNAQYNRCVRYIENNQIKYQLRAYKKDYLRNHVDLILYSIECIANKLYVNWTNVVPFKIESYMKTSLWKNTDIKINTSNNVELLNGYIDTNRDSVSFCDIYNVISNHLYNQIKSRKWLIYDYMINSKPVSCINILQKMIDLKKIFSGTLWSQLNENDKNIFNTQWQIILNSSDETIKKMSSAIYVFFCGNYIESSRLVKTNQLIMYKKEDMFAVKDASIGMKLTPVEDVYMFLYYQITEYKKTWYYYASSSDNKNKIITENSEITLKTIYNFAKSITHYQESEESREYFQFPDNWCSLSPEQIETFIVRLINIKDVDLNDWTRKNWFNNRSFIEKTNPDLGSYSTKDRKEYIIKKNKELYDKIKLHIPSIVIESLMFHGMLSTFSPQPTITDENKSDADRRKNMKEIHFDKKYFNQCFYFLKNEQYDNIIINNKTPTKYLQLIHQKMTWPFTYAMNWVSQINFFHHYCHNRVMYITGSTGVGKSTQIPKLLMYGQITIDYNFNGKIVCTQPRTSPTVKNAETISNELGYPIIEYDNIRKENNMSANYVVQYKYKEDNHEFKNASFLKIVTDGTLYVDIIKSPFLTKTKSEQAYLFSNNNYINDFVVDDNRYVTWTKKFLADNIYDIVIVDEAHEHNTNMDMILTFMRDTINLNNSLKLVIVSATMEDDEPIYRRYYRSINDNRMFPLNNYIATNTLDRSNIDRRIHISPPGKTTKFIINDHYMADNEALLINEKNYVDRSISKTIEIVNTTTTGDVLLFLAGQKDIELAITRINNSTAEHVICFGFFKNMTPEDKKFIENVHVDINNYTRYKSDVIEKKLDKRVSPGTYTRVVIVATNIAEASLTIERLKYVIDSGYSKVNIYNPIKNMVFLKTMLISNSSSQQRRGRVGRVSPGDVYYMYSKNNVSDRKSQYGITNIDTKDMFIELIKNEPNDIPIVNEHNDINSVYFLERIKKNKQYSLKSNLDKIAKHYFPFIDIIEQKYLLKRKNNRDVLLNNINIFYTYYGKVNNSIFTKQDSYQYSKIDFKNNHDDYNFQRNLYKLVVTNKQETLTTTLSHRHYTGFTSSSLVDNALNFYIIHPEENIIIRDLHTGNCFKLKDLDNIDPQYYDSLLLLNDIDVINNNLKATKELFCSKNNNKQFIFYKGKNIVSYYLNRSYIKYITVPSVGFHYSKYKYNNYIDQYFIDVAKNTNMLVLVKTELVKHVDIMARKIKNYTSTSFTLDQSFAYCYSLTRSCEMDILGLMLMFSTFPDLSTLFVSQNILLNNTTKAKLNNQDIEMIQNLFYKCNSDIQIYWIILNDLKSITNFSDAYQATKISLNSDTKFEILKNSYKNNQLMGDNLKLFKQLEESNHLNTSNEYYYYTNRAKFKYCLSNNSKFKILIDNICKKYMLNCDKITEFMKSYLNLIYEVNKIEWRNNYNKIYVIDEDDEDIDVKWIKQHMQFNSVIFKNPQTIWEKVFEIIVKTFSHQIVTNYDSFYVDLITNTIFAKKYWLDTYIVESISNSNNHYIYINTVVVDDNASHITILTPVKIEWVILLNLDLFRHVYNKIKEYTFDNRYRLNTKLLSQYSHFFNKSIKN